LEGVTFEKLTQPDTKSRQIIKKAKIGRTFINGYSGYQYLRLGDIGYQVIITIAKYLHHPGDLPTESQWRGLLSMLDGKYTQWVTLIKNSKQFGEQGDINNLFRTLWGIGFIGLFQKVHLY
jgi:hypothetical protein